MEPSHPNTEIKCDQTYDKTRAVNQLPLSLLIPVLPINFIFTIYYKTYLMAQTIMLLTNKQSTLSNQTAQYTYTFHFYTVLQIM
jgi:hypothetical protein